MKPGKSEKAKTDPPPRITVSGMRLWAFRIIGIFVIPLLVLLAVEAGLRLADYGYPTAAIVPCTIGETDAYCDNVKFGRRFFPENIARELRPFAFKAKKKKGAYRIFVLGASAAKGTPEPAFCFGRFLELMLSEAYPDIAFEIHTAAAVAINSHAVVEIAKACADRDPDLFIVYLGNNEVVGPYGAGTVFSPIASNLFVIRLGLALKATRIGQLVENLIGSFSSAAGAPRAWKGMEMFLDNQVRYDDARLEIVYGHFQKNLEDIRETAVGSGARIIFCTVGSNIKDSPPFASQHREGMTPSELERWDTLYQEGIGHEDAENHTLAIEKYLAAAELDNTYADLQFRLGRCYWALEDFPKAKAAYTMARDMDTLRFRADSRINEIIRRVAHASPGDMTGLADAEAAIAGHSPNGAAGAELFYEHVHLNFSGNYLLGRILLTQTKDLLPTGTTDKRPDNGNVISESECARFLAYTDWDRHRILFDELKASFKRAPFTNQLYHEKRMRLMAAEQDRATRSTKVFREALDQHEQALSKSGSDFGFRKKFAALAVEGGNDALADEQYRFMAENFPLNPTGESGLGFLALERGDPKGAVHHLNRALALLPTSAYAHYNLGKAYWAMGDMPTALGHCFKALALQPDYHGVYNILNREIVRMFQEGRYTEALAIGERLLPVQERALGPKHGSLAATLNNLAGLYQTMGEYAKSEPLYRRALAIKRKTLGPNHPSVATSSNNLAGLLFLMGNLEQAETFYKEALRVNLNGYGVRRQVVAENLSGLASVYSAKGDYAKAQRLYEKALSLYKESLGPNH
ncbi:MAG: tetratricopeptide repeat protein, partial [Deltaproteobacteria bacterium]|nr:tetratricopeptide repeat protein [Deltaproteobacteria bacterium]